MANFSNGSEGADYEETWCVNCQHHGPDGINCPILFLHATHQGDPNTEYLDELIPRSKHKLSNEKCNFHWER